LSIGTLNAVGAKRAEELVRGAGLAVSCVTTAGFYNLRDEAAQREQVERTKRLIAELAPLEPSCLMLASGNDPTRCWEENAPRFRQILDQLLPEAERHNVRLAIEPFSSLRMDMSFLHTLDETLDYVDEFDSPYLGVVFEV